jgi:hypothetical protein
MKRRRQLFKLLLTTLSWDEKNLAPALTLHLEESHRLLLVPLSSLLPLQPPPPHPPLPLPQLNTTVTPVWIINYYCFLLKLLLLYQLLLRIRYIIKHGSELRKNRLTHRVADRSTYASRGLSVSTKMIIHRARKEWNYGQKRLGPDVLVDC